MKITAEIITNIEIILEGLNWIKAIDKPRYPFTIYKNENSVKQLKLPKPSTIEYSGTNDLINELLKELSSDLEIEYEDLIYKVQNPDVTTLEIRYDSESSRSGTIPTGIMEELSKQIPRLISDTYLNMENRLSYRKTFPSNNKIVRDMIENISYGQTKYGSYVIQLHVNSIKEQVQDGGLIDGNEVITLTEKNKGNEAVHNFISSINSVIESVETTETDEELASDLNEILLNKDKTLSVNFAEALSKIQLEDDAKIEITGVQPLIVNNKLNRAERIYSKPYKKEITNNIKIFVNEYKASAKEEVTYIGKFTGFKTSDKEVELRTGISIYFEGANFDSSEDKIEKLTCEIEYDENKQDEINDYIKNSDTIKIKGVKKRKKLTNITIMEKI